MPPRPPHPTPSSSGPGPVLYHHGTESEWGRTGHKEYIAKSLVCSCPACPSIIDASPSDLSGRGRRLPRRSIGELSLPPSAHRPLN